jgi:hypothetical protein
MNAREDGRPCCADRGALAAQKHAKKRIKALDLNGHGKIRINQAGCLDRCEEGPVLVVYPEGTWYTYVDTTTSTTSSTPTWSAAKSSNASRSDS